ncbi:hypothetical protein [Phocaeicola plebeius]|uniref:hypothetical protein n=1 Tax=Phocaeicola plebeius TaxID=310297 RepID=UPI003FEEC5E4
MKQLFFILIAFFTVAVPAVAQQLKTTRWDSYGVSFKAPSDLTVEDDSSEGYLAGNDTYYLTIQLLEGEGMKKEELGQELKAIATDDEVTSQSSVQSFELPQFHGVQLKGNCEEEKCVYSYLLAKDGSCGFYVSIVYRQENDKTPETILKSFHMEE